MRIGVDLDGVTYDFHSVLRDYCQHVTGRWLPEITQWNCWGEWGMTKDEWFRHVHSASALGVLFRKGPALPGAELAIPLLMRDGHEVVIVTHREGQTARWHTLSWLADHRITFDQIIFAADKTVLNLDVLIDDAPHNLEAARACGTRAVRFAQPWNAELDGYESVAGWHEIPALFIGAHCK